MSISEFGVTAEPPAQRPRAAAPAQPRRKTEAAAPVRRAPPVRQPEWAAPQPAINGRWWFYIPAVVKACFKIAFLPVTLLILAAELIMAGLILGAAGLAVGWWLGFIPDTQVIEVARPIGERLLSMVQSLGYL